MTPFRQMNVALARLKPCPVLSLRYLTQGRGRLGLLGYADHTDAVLRKNQGGEGMMTWVETGRVWPFGGVTAWGLRVLVPSRSCLRYQHPLAAGSCPRLGVCASLLAPRAANVRGDPEKGKRSEASSALGNLL